MATAYVYPGEGDHTAVAKDLLDLFGPDGVATDTDDGLAFVVDGSVVYLWTPPAGTYIVYHDDDDDEDVAPVRGVEPVPATAGHLPAPLSVEGEPVGSFLAGGRVWGDDGVVEREEGSELGGQVLDPAAAAVLRAGGIDPRHYTVMELWEVVRYVEDPVVLEALIEVETLGAARGRALADLKRRLRAVSKRLL